MVRLREKDKHILYLIVESYLKQGKPVSSKIIAKECSKYKVSPATVRNIMSKLENLDFLCQPHTSSGRIPKDKGLRAYVNTLFNEAIIPQSHINDNTECFYFEKNDFNSLLIQISKVLSNSSGNIGFVLSPRLSKINFKNIRFIKVADEKIMIILVTSSDLVLSDIIKTDNYFTQFELDNASIYLNNNFRGKSLINVRDYIIKDLPKLKARYENKINRLITLLKNHFNHEEKENKVFFEGTTNLFGKEDLVGKEYLRTIFQNFEMQTKLVKLLSDFISFDRVKVIIGNELKIPDIMDFSLVISNYGYRHQILGSLGIIGPKTIPYRSIIPLVDHVAKRLNQTISISQ